MKKGFPPSPAPPILLPKTFVCDNYEPQAFPITESCGLFYSFSAGQRHKTFGTSFFTHGRPAEYQEHHRNGFPRQRARQIPASPPLRREDFSCTAFGSYPSKIWKSFPLTRLSGEGRTGVGHRRWVRQDTPALSPQTEPRTPSTLPLATAAFPNARASSATRFAFPPAPAERRSLRQNQGGRGGNYF